MWQQQVFSTFLQDLSSFIALLNIYKVVATLSNHYKSIDSIAQEVFEGWKWTPSKKGDKSIKAYGCFMIFFRMFSPQIARISIFNYSDKLI